MGKIDPPRRINPENLRSTDALHPDTAGAAKILQIIHLFHPLFGKYFIFFDALQILREVDLRDKRMGLLLFMEWSYKRGAALCQFRRDV